MKSAISGGLTESASERPEEPCLRHGGGGVAVKTAIAGRPQHGSVRAEFPPTALASGGDAKALQRMRMGDMGRRQPAVNESFGSLPGDATFLAPSSEYLVPELSHGKPKVGERVPITRYSVIPDVPAH